MPDGCVDAVITDPPYGIGHPCDFAARGRGSLAICNDYPNIVGDNKPFDPSPLLELDVPTILWGANYYADRLPPSGGWLVWDKERPDDLDQSTCELAWTNCIRGVRRLRYLWNGMIRAGEKEALQHPTQKPVALFIWIFGLRWMRNVRCPFDPYMGVGSSGVAAMNLHLDYVGCEIDPGYFEIAKRRIEQAATQPPLFTLNIPKSEQLSLLEAS